MREWPSGGLCTRPPDRRLPAYFPVPRLCVGKWLMFDEASHAALDTVLSIASKASTARLEGLPTSLLPMAPPALRHLYAINPSFVDDDNGVLVKLTPYSFCTINSTGRSSFFDRRDTFSGNQLLVQQFFSAAISRRARGHRAKDKAG